MDPHAKASLLWGAVGALSFLVLVQGYQLLTEASVGIWVVFGVGAVVGTVATGLTYVAGDRFRR